VKIKQRLESILSWNVQLNTITARNHLSKGSNAIKSSRARRESTSRSSPSSLPLRYDNRATGNVETTSALIPSARHKIIHHFSRRFPHSDVVCSSLKITPPTFLDQVFGPWWGFAGRALQTSHRQDRASAKATRRICLVFQHCRTLM